MDSALLSELGERLVTSYHVALAELIKNSYDADATEVRLVIDKDSDGQPLIEISDNGCGMTFAEIKKFWMKIGTPHKAHEDNVSKIFGRPVSGAKGIGRFSVRKLGPTVQVISKAKLLDQKTLKLK